MATVPASFPPPGGSNDGSVLKAVWNLANLDDGAPFGNPEYSDRTVQATGNFGAGGSVALEGSNDGGTTWFPVTNPAGDPVVFTAAGGMAIIENTQMLRPRATVAVTNVNLILMARRGSGMRQ